MKYVILIYSNPQSREMWDSFPSSAKVEGLKEYGALVESLVASGELVATEALDPGVKRVTEVRDGRAIVSDGPFAEVKELLAGIFIVDCASEERALEIAARIPEAPLGLVEVRPVRSLDPAEW